MGLFLSHSWHLKRQPCSSHTLWKKKLSTGMSFMSVCYLNILHFKSPWKMENNNNNKSEYLLLCKPGDELWSQKLIRSTTLFSFNFDVQNLSWRLINTCIQRSSRMSLVCLKYHNRKFSPKHATPNKCKMMANRSFQNCWICFTLQCEEFLGFQWPTKKGYIFFVCLSFFFFAKIIF